MSTITTFSVNDMVFIDNIGYGTLMDCGKLKSISLKQIPSTLQRRQSIYFDPQLFNSESQTLAKQKSQASVLVPNPKEQAKIIEQQKVQKPVKTQQQSQKIQPKQQQQNMIEQPTTNIVKVKLQGTNAIVYTSDINIRKHVIIPIRPLFAPALGTINIKIQVGKTIQSLKRQIFELLGLKHSHYFNVKLFTTTPFLNQLNSASKTIWQYGIRQSSTLTMTAQHGFCFQTIPQHLTQYFNLLNNNLTLVSLPKKPKVVTNIVIALPPPTDQTQNTTSTQTQSPTKKTNQQQTQVNAQQPKKVQQQPTTTTVTQPKKQQQTQQKPKQKIEQIKQQRKPQIQAPETISLNGDKIMRSGKQYFEVRLDKLPHNTSHLKIGIISQNKQKYWYFCPLISQKIYEQKNEIKSTQNYGMTFKQNDIIGVLIRIDKYKNMKINFFRNNINLGLCFQSKITQIKFIFTIGSQGQISLDTRAQFPVDSYRFR